MFQPVNGKSAFENDGSTVSIHQTASVKGYCKVAPHSLSFESQEMTAGLLPERFIFDSKPFLFEEAFVKLTEI